MLVIASVASYGRHGMVIRKAITTVNVVRHKLFVAVLELAMIALQVIFGSLVLQIVTCHAHWVPISKGDAKLLARSMMVQTTC